MRRVSQWPLVTFGTRLRSPYPLGVVRVLWLVAGDLPNDLFTNLLLTVMGFVPLLAVVYEGFLQDQAGWILTVGERHRSIPGCMLDRQMTNSPP